MTYIIFSASRSFKLHILLLRRQHVLNLLYKFGMTRCKSISKYEDNCRFQQIIRNLIYLTITQPDLTWIVISNCYDMSMVYLIMVSSISAEYHFENGRVPEC